MTWCVTPTELLKRRTTAPPPLRLAGRSVVSRGTLVVTVSMAALRSRQRDIAVCHSDYARRLLLGGLALLASSAAPAGAPVGVEGADASVAVLDLEGRSVRPLGGPSAGALVFVFVRTDCPIANRYAPELRRLHARFAPGGVAFHVVYVDPAESVAAIRRHLSDYGHPGVPLRDPEHALVRVARARVTPEAAVFVPGPSGPQLVYHGRIDDRTVDFGRERPAPTTHDLELALAAVLGGRPVPRGTAQAVGCTIADTR
jgi:hypothetical protein